MHTLYHLLSSRSRPARVRGWLAFCAAVPLLAIAAIGLVSLPRQLDLMSLGSEAAAARGVQFVKGSDFVLEGAESSLRLAYSGVTPEQIEEGVKLLAEAYAEVSNTASAV